MIVYLHKKNKFKLNYYFFFYLKFLLITKKNKKYIQKLFNYK